MRFCRRIWREPQASPAEAEWQSVEVPADADLNVDGAIAMGAARKTPGQAILLIPLADVSLSPDSVEAVVGAAQEHPRILVIGLALSTAFAGLAAPLIVRLPNKRRWIAEVGLAIILTVALHMIWHLWEAVAPAIPEACVPG